MGALTSVYGVGREAELIFGRQLELAQAEAVWDTFQKSVAKGGGGPLGSFNSQFLVDKTVESFSSCLLAICSSFGELPVHVFMYHTPLETITKM